MLDSILLLSLTNQTTSVNDKIQAKTEAVNTLLNTKFAILRIWFETNETMACESSSAIDNEEELKEIIEKEFTGCVNNWLNEAMGYFKLSAPKSMVNVEFSIENNNPHQNLINPNQIASYKNSQTISQFICDIMVNYLDNCRQFMLQSGGTDTQLNPASPSILQILTVTSCQLLSEIF